MSYHGKLSSASTGRLAALRFPLTAVLSELNVVLSLTTGTSTPMSSSRSDMAEGDWSAVATPNIRRDANCSDMTDHRRVNSRYKSGRDVWVKAVDFIPLAYPGFCSPTISSHLACPCLSDVVVIQLTQGRFQLQHAGKSHLSRRCRSCLHVPRHITPSSSKKPMSGSSVRLQPSYVDTSTNRCAPNSQAISPSSPSAHAPAVPRTPFHLSPPEHLISRSTPMARATMHSTRCSASSAPTPSSETLRSKVPQTGC